MAKKPVTEATEAEVTPAGNEAEEEVFISEATKAELAAGAAALKSFTDSAAAE